MANLRRNPPAQYVLGAFLLCVCRLSAGCSLETADEGDLGFDSGVTAAEAGWDCIHAPIDGATFAFVESALPDRTLTDWVSYSDAVAVFRVESETLGDVSIGYRARFVGARVLEILWEPEMGSSGLAVDHSLELDVLGWGESGQALQARGAVRWTVGESYLAPVADFHPQDWAPLTPQTAIPTDGVRLESAECMGKLGAAHPLGSILVGRTLAEARDLIRATPRDPSVEAYRHLPPKERFDAASGQP